MRPSVRPRRKGSSVGADIELVGVTKRFAVGAESSIVAADDVTLTIPAGRTTALVGPSGSGKSTLLHLIGAIEEVDSGTITVDGVVVTGLSRRQAADYRSRVGFVFQQFHLIPALTLVDNVAAPLMGRPFDGDRRKWAAELLDAVGLGSRLKARPSELSGGQQQRVAIARALVAKPTLILADEPTGNLDSVTAVEVMELLAGLLDSVNATLVVATHDEGLAATCDLTVGVLDGRTTVKVRT